jgi:hypothetical protein
MENSKEEKIIKNFIDTFNLIEPIKSTYKTIRIWLQREGYTTKTAEKVSYMPVYILEAYRDFNNQFRQIKNEVKKYGFENSENTINQIVSKELLNIDKEFPLVDELE